MKAEGYKFVWKCTSCGQLWKYDSRTTSPLHCPECLLDDFHYMGEVDDD